MVVGVTNETGNFFPAMSVLTTHEDHAAWEEIYGYIHSLNIHPSFRMADGAEALEKIWKLSILSELIPVDVLESPSLDTKIETCRSC